MKILITNCLSRKAFDLINILTRSIERGDIIFASDGNLKKMTIVYGSENCYLLRLDSFSADLTLISKKYKDEEIIYYPVEENVTLRIYEYVEEYGIRNFKYILPSLESYNLSRDKKLLNSFCEGSDIPCPKFYSEAAIKAKNFKLPLILKPRIGTGSEGIMYIHSEEDLASHPIDYKKYFAQELMNNPREVEAGFFLCDQGRVLSFYSHQRIKTFPEQGGVSVLSVAKVNQKIKIAGSEIIKKLNWSGLIMIEFLKDNLTKEYKIIEINPRVWGSILLSEFNNSKMISSYLRLCEGARIIEGKVSTDKYLRWIFPYELLLFFKNPRLSFKCFRKGSECCYVNFTYSDFFKSVRFIILTYFDLGIIRRKLFYGKRNNCL